MNEPNALTPATENMPTETLDVRQRGRWLVVVRTSWVMVVLMILSLFITCLPLYFTAAQTICTGACSIGQLTLDNVRALQALGISLTVYAIFMLVLAIAFAFVWFVIGGIIFWCKSDNRMARISALTLIMFGTSNVASTLTGIPSAWQTLETSFNELTILLLLGFFSLFPNGRFVPGFMRWILLGFVVVSAGFTLFPQLAGIAGSFLYLGFIGSIVAAQIYRYRRVSSPRERQQTKWVVFGLAVAIMLIMTSYLLYIFFPALRDPHQLYGLFVSDLEPGVYVVIPLSIGIAILRDHLWDIDVIINRTLVYGTLTAGIVGFYILVVGSLGALLRTGNTLPISLLATGVVAVLFQPLRGYLQTRVNRLMYGERETPYTVIARLGQRLEAAFAPKTVLPTIVETVAQSLKLPYVAITLKQKETFLTAASYGSVRENLVRLPLVYQNEMLGELILAPRAAGENFSTADRRLLTDLGRQAGIATHAVRLTAELQRSRERLVTAREEERRRLRRDLHDGLGPTLGALTLKVGSARALFLSNPLVADRLLGELENDIEEAVVDIRRLVYALRPPALDELGLLGALRECAVQYTRPESMSGGQSQEKRLAIVIETPERLPELPAAVEVAAYRITQEALTNVARHAQARTCVVRIVLADGLHVEVCDDGIGLPTERHAGVGLTSMQERATELGGTCLIEARPAGGTRVFALLPVPKSAEVDTEEQQRSS
jgi:signal transduction histidine kinase